MNNPYAPPEASAPARLSTKTPLWQTVASMIIVLYCSVQYLAVSVALISGWDTLMEGVDSLLLLALSKVWQPALLFISGILLLFRKRYAVLGFASYLIAALLTFPILEFVDVALGVMTVFCITLFAAFLLKTGRLR